MKKTLTFIPLGIGISAAIIYVFNVIQFRVINNSATLLQILSNLKVYLYVAIAGFVCYFLIRVLTSLDTRKKVNKNDKENKKEETIDNDYEPFEKVTGNDIIQEAPKGKPVINTYVPNYDYVPMYHEPKKNVVTNDIQTHNQEDNNTVNQINHKPEEKIKVAGETKKDTNTIINGNSYCYNCGESIYSTDKYCHNCGARQFQDRKAINPVLKNIINVLEIVILLLVIYFSLNMLFDYKESKDPNFTSPFKVGMTKK